MAHLLTASDRESLIKLASTLPVGSPERKAILAGLMEDTKTRVYHPDFGLGWADPSKTRTTMVQFDDANLGAWKGWRKVQVEDLEVVETD